MKYSAVNFSNKLHHYYRKLFTKFILSYSFGSIGNKSIVFKQNRLINPECIFVGEKVILIGNSRLELITHYLDDTYEPMLIIGNDSQIHQNCHITCADRIEIGNNVIIVSNVTITDIIHPHEDPFSPINKNKILTKPVIIGDQSYLYNNSVILPGATIGKHCIIGANSVVRDDIPDYSIAVGNPAQVVKQYNFQLNNWEDV